MGKLNEKRIELNNPYPVSKKEIIDLVERSSRLVHTATDDKTIQLYIYSNGSERPEAFAEVEITSVGYILHGAEGYDYQGSSMKEFEEDLKDVVFNFDATTSRRIGESNTINKENLFESLLNEAETTKYMACCYDPEDYYEETNYIDEDGELSCNSSGAKLFNTEDEAIEYADENKPIGWMSFAMPFNTTLKEGRVSLDDKIKIIERFKAYCIKYEVDAQPVGECSDGIYVYCNNPDDVKRIIKDWREKGFGAVSDGQKVNIYKKSSTILESDDTYKAKVNGKWLKGNKLVKDKKDADTFESKTEPTQRINQMKKDGKINKNAKPTIMKEYVSNQITNTFMRHGVEKYFHEYIIVVDDDWYTPCEFISENGLEDSFGPEYVFEQVVIAVKSSIRWLKNQGVQPDENDEDVSYNLWEMIDFIGSLKENTTENKNQLFESLLQEEKNGNN